MKYGAGGILCQAYSGGHISLISQQDLSCDREDFVVDSSG